MSIATLSFDKIEKAEKIDLDEELKFKSQIKRVLSGRTLSYLFRIGNNDEHLELLDFKLNRTSSKRNLFRRLKNPLTIIGIVIILMLITWATHAPWISPFTKETLQDLDMAHDDFRPPSPIHWFGTMTFGQDTFGRLIWGARVSLSIGLIAISIGTISGVIIGTIVAYQGGILDGIVMRIVDVIMAFPNLILIVLVVESIGDRDIQTILLTLGVLSIPGYARLMRGAVLQEKNKIYVEAAKVSGASSARVMFRHVLPNAFTPILISLTFRIGTITLTLAGLAFLGYGARNEIEWGWDVNRGQTKLLIAPWAALWPGVAIMLAVLGFMLFGDGLRDALDPRSKA
jgi:ABC-type dipeptide/oligopeptide/nickel transport system permease subunit